MMSSFRSGMTLATKVRPYILLLLFSLMLLLPGIATLPVIDRDEAHFAQASRQMVQTGQYFQVRFQEVTRFQKPPGINWLQALFVKTLSDANASRIWPYRLPSLFGTLLAILLTYFLARRMADPKIAMLAALLLSSTLLLNVETHMAVIDASLLASIVLMQTALWVLYRGQTRHDFCWAMLFWLAMTYGFLLKGVTPLVGFSSLAALCMMERRVGWLKQVYVPFGFFMFIALSVAWLLLVNEAEQSNYLWQMLHKDLLPKLQGGHESHGKPPLFHLAILPLTFWPASLFLWLGALYAYRYRTNPEIRFLLAWVVPTWLFFELMPTKLPQYVLPTFPALAIVCALGIHRLREALEPGKGVHGLQLLWGILSIGFGIGVLGISFYILKTLSLVAVLLFMSVGLLTGFSLYYAWTGRQHRACVTVLGCSVLIFPLIFSGVLPALKPLWISHIIAEKAHLQPLSDTNPLLVVGYGEPSLVFYLNTRQVLFTNIQTATERLHEKKGGMLLVDEEEIKHLEDIPNRIVLAKIRGFNYSKGKWINLVLLTNQKITALQTLERL